MSIDNGLSFLSRDYSVGDRGGAWHASTRAFNVGEKFDLTVLEHLRSRHYRVPLGNSYRTVQSNVELTPGTKLMVQVAAGGDRLVMRSVDPQVGGVSLQEDGTIHSSGGHSLSELAARHRVALDAEQSSLIEHPMVDADEPKAMAVAGLFLGKFGLPLDAAAMQSVYGRQVWSLAGGQPPPKQPTMAENPIEQISASMMSQLDTPVPEGLGGGEDVTAQPLDLRHAPTSGDAKDGQGHGSDRHDQHALAQRLLNTQNHGSVDYRYGVLPLLISEQLVELDLLCFQSPAASLQAGLRRLTMTFNSAALGRVEVTAQALGTRLVLNIRTASASPSEALSAHAGEVRELVGRLGWNVESLSYGHDVQPPRAATQLVQHALNADTLSRLL